MTNFPFYEKLKRVAAYQTQARWASEMKKLTDEAAEVIGVPVKEWEARCYEIACSFIRHGLIPGRPAYGHYYGEVLPGGQWDPKRLFQRHGWILTIDHTIADPTCFFFTQGTPAIRLFEADNMDYDEGGDAIQNALRQPYPGEDQSFGTSDPTLRWTIKVSPACLERLTDAAKADVSKVSLVQLHWLATLPMSVLGEHALEFFRYLESVSHRVLIPIDHQIMAGLVDPMKK